MSAIDLDRLLAEISPEAPSGEKDLEGDEEFVELQKKIEGTPARFDGTRDIPAIDPNWQEVRDTAFKLLTRTHDLRVAMSFTRAMLHTAGVKGLSIGLELLSGLIDQYWETLYPRLDPEDNEDPTQRINILEALYYEKDIDIIGPLPKTNLCEYRGLGQFSLRDIQIASGKVQPTKNDKTPTPTTDIIEAAFKKSAVEDLQATQDAINASLQHLNNLDTLLKEKVGSTNAPEPGKLKDILEEMKAVMEKQLEGRLAAGPGEEGAAVESQYPDNSQSDEKRDNPMGVINTRQDVINALDKICTYYQNNEPGSPVPLLLKRARQLVEKNFFEIMQDLGLDSAAQIKTLFNGAADDTS